ncbi:MAG: class D beta-lactamase [Acidobacteria bacterium]|jgi:beta-lactamase class D|nr:class D beta-lactamase [Acidobacteriota bacterium]
MKKSFFCFLIFICLGFICLAQEPAQPAAIKTGSLISTLSEKDFQEIFTQFKVTGTFIIYDLEKNTYNFFNKERAEKAFLPASTFKIPNSLIALETGAIKDQCDIIAWDQKVWRFDEWNQDQTLATAFRNSVVWAYQELARRIGKKQMQYWIDKIEYGNRDISDAIDTFWLEGNLKISAYEQVEFLVKLYKNQLPFSRRTMDIVKEIMIVEQGTYILRGKTGWASRVAPQIGWFVGWLEKTGNVYFFALNIDIVNRQDVNARIGVTKEIFKHLKLIE